MAMDRGSAILQAAPPNTPRAQPARATRFASTCAGGASGGHSADEGAGMRVEAGIAKGRVVTLPARPEPIRVSADETAIVVIDMQNAYASPGGYLDLAGFDIGGAAAVIEQSSKVIETARAAGMTIVYFQNGW